MLVELSRLPRHVAIIMDGNGRWAKERERPRWEGHREGAKAVREIVTAARRLGVQALTLYAFSEQNWARPEEEVSALMALLQEFLIGERETLLSNGIRLRAIGRVHRLPAHLQNLLRELAESSSAHEQMTLSICLSYGGREELADAAQELARQVERGELRPEQINEQAINDLLPSAKVGPVDLLIRTGGELRTSNFLIWAAAYAELYFSPKLWPEYHQGDLYEAIAAFQQRNRRFGLADNVEGPAAAMDPEHAPRTMTR